MKKAHLFRTSLLAIAALFTGTQSQADIVAFDLVGSASQNLDSYTNVWTDAFASPGDGFQIYQRGVSPSIPFSVLDDSVAIFPADNLGIIDETNLDTFFGVTDTENADVSGPISAEWVFDVAGFTDLSVSIDMGAMGDFESSDVFAWSVSIDGDPAMDIFTSSVDNSGSLTYTMAGGLSYTYNDPMSVNGIQLDNSLQTITSGVPLGGGNLLTLTLMATTNGGSEAFAFQNIVIEGTAAVGVSEPSILLMFGLGVAVLGFVRRR